MKILKQGAEAIIYLENNEIIKHRIKKNYRINEIDIKKRKYPTRIEAKLLQKAISLGVNVPSVNKVDEKDFKLVLEYINGKIVRDYVDNLNEQDIKKIFNEIGNEIAKLHDGNIIHGDLTTANFILRDNKIFIIDFGLGFTSEKVENKAVDLRVLKQALESKHSKISELAFNEVLIGYSKSKTYEMVVERLGIVSLRGRYKRKKK
ncbi:Kae1-associated serine/threonine protein kinase [Candidatus Woesearchaeota archaeon]|nr:Kae1-associated serine/threonine protein kinase [Candidatus Woesearchaeota archaeon]